MNRPGWTAGDENVARLLGRSYDPPPVSAEFAERVRTRLLEVAAEAALRRAAAPPHSSSGRRVAALAGVAAVLGLVALGLRFLPSPPGVRPPRRPAAFPQTVAAPAPAPVPAPVLSPGETLATGAGERRRLALPDGSVLSLNENTAVRHDSPRHLTLSAGEIFVEATAHPADGAPPLLTVATPHREVRAADTKFLVRAGADGTGVAVTRGQAQVSDHDGRLTAGQELGPKAAAVTAAPRASHLLDWTRDLVVSASSPLVPPSDHTGGSLVAHDPQGQAAPLALRKYHIDVHVEDGFARTTIDQTYFNHSPARLEGTFYFPLPADASLSRLAMYVDGRLMEGGMVERDHGRTVFEQIVTKMKDPALLEWVDGRTFKMRVFPLEARQEKRIILSYTQRLPDLYGRLSYRFPAGHSLGEVRDWSAHVRVKGGAKFGWHCDSHALTPRVEDGDLLLDAAARQAPMDRDLTLTLVDPAPPGAARFAAAEQDGWRYLMLRYRPELNGPARRPRRDWVFLFESSADRDPILARTQAEVVRTLLENAEHDDTFNVLTADTRVRRFAPSSLRVTPENVAAALAFLDSTHLLGALDLDAGLTAAAELLQAAERPVLVHLGSGRAVLGERGAEALAGRIPPGCGYVGVAVGEQRTPDFMQRAADRCQGLVTQINPDDSVRWRAFELLDALNAPRLSGVKVVDPAGTAQFLSPSTVLAQGEQLCAIARLPAGAPLPRSVRIAGTLDGAPHERELPVESPRGGADYLPRTWARLEINRLLAENARKNKAAIVELSKAMYVMTPYTSLLVLENEAMYAQYGVDRGRKDHWALYPCPPTISVISEPPPQDEFASSDPFIAPVPLPVTRGWRGAFQAPPAIPLYGGHVLPLASYANNGVGYSSSQSFMFLGSGLPLATYANNGVGYGGTQWMMNPYAGYLRGSEAVTNASADWKMKIQQAKLQREEARRSVLRTRREALEEAEYERAHMPDPEKIRQEQIQRELDHARVAPPLTEVWSGRALNVLLRHLVAQQRQGVKGPNIPISEDVLKSINLTAGDTRGNVGLLKDNGNLQWPQPLRADAYKEAREDFAQRFKQAVNRVKANRTPDEATIKALEADLRKLDETLDANVGDLSPDQYIDAKRYLRLLRNAVTALKDRNTVNVFNGNWAARGATVAELVQHLGEKRLRFAPAVPDDEPAYLALYHALAAFDAALPRTADGELALMRRPRRVSFSADAPRTPDVPDPVRAERTLSALLADPAQARRPSLWRQAADVAECCGQYETALQRLARAWELESGQSPDLDSLRRDFSRFFRLADKAARELTARHQGIPRELVDRIMAVADRWRAVDPEDWLPCDLAARVLQMAGERELAWGYLTTPAALHGSTIADWLEVAREQHRQGEFDLAERAFAAASSFDPANGEVVWERALNHRAAGRTEAAFALFRRLDQEAWDERYEAFQIGARRMLRKGQ